MSELSTDKFDDLVIRLYRAARSSAFFDFRRDALLLMTNHFRFDSAIWGLGIYNERVKISSIYLHNLPQTMMTDYAKVSHLDTLAQRISMNMGTTFCASSTDAEFALDCNKPLLSFQAKYSIANAISTAYPDRDIGLGHFLTLFRSRHSDVWTESDRVLKQRLAPHLTEAYVQARRLHTRPMGLDSCPHAIADHNLVLGKSSEGFDELMKQEWPGWRGKRLPEQVRLRFTAGLTYFVGRRITVSMETEQSLVYVWARISHAMDQLSPAELQVAVGVAQGLSNKEIAAGRGTSVSTVMNQVKNVYAKLGIVSGNRAALAKRMVDVAADPLLRSS